MVFLTGGYVALTRYSLYTPAVPNCQRAFRRRLKPPRRVPQFGYRLTAWRYSTVDDTGVHVPSLETALAATRQQMADIFGDDLAGDAQTPQGQLAGIIAILEAAIGEALVQLGNATSVDDAVGTQLDTLGELLDILRQRATRSRLTATLTGVGGTGVPGNGSRAKTAADPAAEFRTIADAVLSPSPGVAVEMEAVEEGPGSRRRRNLDRHRYRHTRLGNYQQRRRRHARHCTATRSDLPHGLPHPHGASRVGADGRH